MAQKESHSSRNVKNTSSSQYIIPSIIEDGEPGPSSTKGIGMIGSTERERNPWAQDEVHDRTQHYFSDQIKYRRPKYTKPWFAMMTMVAICIDVSSVSSFPATVANNGGLAFLLAYLIAMAVFVFPYIYLEAIIGQYFQISMIGIWGICPLFKGLSIGCFATCFLLAAFNPTVTTWSFYLMFEGFKSIQSNSVPWATCNNPWNSCNCDGPLLNVECHGLNRTNSTQANSGYNAAWEYYLAVILRIWKTKYTDPEIIKSVVDNGDESLSFGFSSEDGLGSFIIPSGVILSFFFVLVLIVCGSNLTITGYIYTVTSVFPVVVLILLICRGIGIEGAIAGITKYMTPDWMKLADPWFWLSTAQAAFFSMSVGLGIHLATASFNPLHHDLFNDILGVIILDTSTRILGCLSMYAFVGHVYISKSKDLPDKYSGSGLHFPFTTIAESVGSVSGAGFFAFLYYLMIILFVLDTGTVALQIIIRAMYEEYRRKYPEQSVSEAVFLFGTVGCAFGLAMITMTRGGFWVALFASEFNFHLSFNLFPAIQCIVFTWIWGLENICKAVNRIYGEPPHFLLRICWKFICPTTLVAFLVIHLKTHKKLTMPKELGTMAPDGALPLAILLTYVSVSLFLLYTIGVILQGLKHGVGLTFLMLLISPEYEHPEIKENICKAKRLHWKHYLFIYSSEELKELSIWQRLKGTFCSHCKCFNWICKRKKARIQVADGGHGGEAHQHHHEHHHHEDKDKQAKEDKKARQSLWSLLSADVAHHHSDEHGDYDIDPEHPEK